MSLVHLVPFFVLETRCSRNPEIQEENLAEHHNA